MPKKITIEAPLPTTSDTAAHSLKHRRESGPMEGPSEGALLSKFSKTLSEHNIDSLDVLSIHSPRSDWIINLLMRGLICQDLRLIHADHLMISHRLMAVTRIKNSI